MKQEDYVSYDVAKLLKEKGYNETCRGYYYENKFYFSVCNEYNNLKTDSVVDAPSLAQAAKWMREEKQIWVSVIPVYDKPYEIIDYRVRIATYCDLMDGKKGHLIPLSWFEKYEQALSEGIKEALKLI